MLKRFSIVFLASLIGTLLFSTLLSSQAWAANPAYLVQDVRVDIEAPNAVQAKDKAFTRARERGFEMLMQRMAEGESAGMPGQLALEQMIEGVELTEESFAPGRYIGVFNIQFKESAVTNYLRNKGVAFRSINTDPILLLPYLFKGDRYLLWDQGNEWLAAWQTAPQNGALSDIIIPVGDIEDIQDAPADNPFGYDTASLQNLTSRYGAQDILIAVDTGENRIDLYHADGEAPTLIKSFTDYGAYNVVTQQIVAFLNTDWKNQSYSSGSGVAARVDVLVPFGSLKQWLNTRSRLENSKFITHFDVTNLSAGSATVTLHYSGEYERLVTAMRQIGFGIEQPAVQGYYDEYGYFRTVDNTDALPRLVPLR